MIRKIEEETQTEINVEDDGTVEIAAVSGENARKAINWIESLTREVEVGAIYLGKVTRLMTFGAFVEILPGKEGLVRIGELADYHVPCVEDVVSVATRSWWWSPRSTARAASTCAARLRCSGTSPSNPRHAYAPGSHGSRGRFSIPGRARLVRAGSASRPRALEVRGARL